MSPSWTLYSVAHGRLNAHSISGMCICVGARVTSRAYKPQIAPQGASPLVQMGLVELNQRATTQNRARAAPFVRNLLCGIVPGKQREQKESLQRAHPLFNSKDHSHTRPARFPRLWNRHDFFLRSQIRERRNSFNGKFACIDMEISLFGRMRRGRQSNKWYNLYLGWPLDGSSLSLSSGKFNLAIMDPLTDIWLSRRCLSL